MAIKVKHEGNVTSRITAAARGGRGKRAAEDGKAWAQIAASEAQAANRQLQGAHASPVAPGHASAQLIHAPTGAAPGIAHAPAGGGGGGSRGSGASGSGRSASADGGSGRRRLKVTGDKFFQKPDKESQWDWDSRQWVREYLPGEWEAEEQQRVGDVKNAQQMELDEHKAGLARQEYDYKLSSQQKSEISKITDGLDQARQSGRFTDEELAELERQAYAKIMGVKPLPTPVTEPPKPNVQEIDGVKYVQNGQKWDPVQTPAAPQSAAEVYGGTHVDEQGRRWGVDAHGKLYEVGGQKDDFASLLKLVPETRTEMKLNPATGKEEPVEVPLSMEERLAQLEQIRQMRDKFNAPKPDPRPLSTFDPLSPPWMKDAFLRVDPDAPIETDPNVLLTNGPQPYRGVAPSPDAQILRNGAPAPAGAPPAPPSERDKRWSTFKRS